MSALRYLARCGELNLLLPDVVAKELLTNDYERALSEYRDLHKAAKNLQSQMRNDLALQKQLAAILDAFSSPPETIKSKVDREFNEWIREFGFEQVPIDDGDGAQVMNQYFSGTGPFTGIKKRNDIPDAFIAKSIERYAEVHGEVKVLVCDKALGKYLSSLQKVDIYASLDHFIEAHSDQGFARYSGDLNATYADDIAWLNTVEFAKYLATHLEKTEESRYVYLEGEQVVDRRARIHDRWALTVEGFSPPIEGLVIHDVLAVDHNVFILEFSFIAEAEVDFCTNFGYQDDPTGGIHGRYEIISMNGDGIVEVVEPHRVRFHCELHIQAETHVAADGLKDQVIACLSRVPTSGFEPPRIDANFYRAELL